MLSTDSSTPGEENKVTQVHVMESLLETAHCNARKMYDKYREQSFKVERTDPSDICTFKFVNALFTEVNALFTEVKATSDTCIFLCMSSKEIILWNFRVDAQVAAGLITRSEPLHARD